MTTITTKALERLRALARNLNYAQGELYDAVMRELGATDRDDVQVQRLVQELMVEVQGIRSAATD